ncbi:MAG: hypothetical protein ACKPKO_10325, partial [Candidatus Fonsibacter sp.]
SLSAKFWCSVYVGQGITIQKGISIGMYNAASPNQFAQTATIAQNGESQHRELSQPQTTPLVERLF